MLIACGMAIGNAGFGAWQLNERLRTRSIATSSIPMRGIAKKAVT
jgi:hypothetical protein